MRLNYIFLLLIPISVDSININRRNSLSIISNSIIGKYTLENSNSKFLNKDEKNSKDLIYSFLTPEFPENNIYFHGPVDDFSVQSISHLLIDIDTKNYRKQFIDICTGVEPSLPEPIHLHIQSYGGSVIPGISLAETIQHLNTPVYTYIDGYAASAATIISIVGKKRYMTENSLMLIHQISSNQEGKYKELKNDMINLETLTDIIRKLYLNHTSIDENTLDELLGKDLWLNSTECLSYGLVDKII